MSERRARKRPDDEATKGARSPSVAPSRRRPAVSSRRRGFTLTETITAILILGVALPPMLWSLRSAHASQVNPVLASRARWLAIEKLEDIIADRHSGTRGYAYLDTANYPDETTITDFTGFQRTVTLNETEADLVTSGTGYMNISVNVSWTDATGVARTMVVSTVLTEYVP